MVSGFETYGLIRREFVRWLSFCRSVAVTSIANDKHHHSLFISGAKDMRPYRASLHMSTFIYALLFHHLYIYTFIESWKYVCVSALKPDIFDAGNNPKIDKFTWGVHRGVRLFHFHCDMSRELLLMIKLSLIMFQCIRDKSWSIYTVH